MLADLVVLQAVAYGVALQLGGYARTSLQREVRAPTEFVTGTLELSESPEIII